MYKHNLTKLFGSEYEHSLLHEIIGTKEKRGTNVHRNFSFGENIINVLTDNIFENESAQETIRIIKAFYEKYQTIPFYNSILRAFRKKYVSEPTIFEEKKAFLKKVHLSRDVDFYDVRKTAIQFIQTRNLYIAAKHIEKIADEGQIDKFDECIDIIQKVLEISDVEENDYEVTEGDYTDLRDSKRLPIPTGLEGLDNVLNGGLSKGELGVIVAGLKVGKTTMATYCSNEAFKAGYNVLQIFFEDTPEQIRKKQRGRWSKLGLSSIGNDENERYIKETSDKKIKQAKDKGGRWILKKFSSKDTTVTKIERYIKKKITQGFVPDIIFIDYIDCITPEKSNYRTTWEGEPEIMRGLEDICSKDKLNFACWAFTQGNRGSINAEIVDIEQMGGNLKKAQIGHVIVTLAKTREQRQEKMANISVIASRVGEDGIVFRNCKFDNGKMIIEVKHENSKVIPEKQTNDFK